MSRLRSRSAWRFLKRGKMWIFRDHMERHMCHLHLYTCTITPLHLHICKCRGVDAFACNYTFVFLTVEDADDDDKEKLNDEDNDDGFDDDEDDDEYEYMSLNMNMNLCIYVCVLMCIYIYIDIYMSRSSEGTLRRFLIIFSAINFQVRRTWPRLVPLGAFDLLPLATTLAQPPADPRLATSPCTSIRRGAEVNWDGPTCHGKSPKTMGFNTNMISWLGWFGVHFRNFHLMKM